MFEPFSKFNRTKNSTKLADVHRTVATQWMIPEEERNHYHSWKEHLKMSKIAMFGCELL
jgi:hypothetical protein